LQQRAQHADRGGLACPVRPEKPEDLPRRDRELDALDGLQVTELLDEPVDLDGQRGPGAHRASQKDCPEYLVDPTVGISYVWVKRDMGGLDDRGTPRVMAAAA